MLYFALSNEVSSKAWAIDSESSRHITGYKEVLHSILEEVDEKVTIGDNSSPSAKGIGNCTFKLKSGISLHLKRENKMLQM